MRRIIVQKFGGTSVADTEKIKNVARTVIKEKINGNDVVVVVSAMGHTTDYLIKLAKEVTNNPDSREMDMLLSTGEQVSIAKLANDIIDTPATMAVKSHLRNNNPVFPVCPCKRDWSLSNFRK